MNAHQLDITTYGDNMLKQIAEPVAVISQETQQLIINMIKTMRAANGIGLAAPQVGHSLRLIVVQTDPEKKKVMALINPEIIACSGEMSGEEGCLSLPGLTGEVLRHSAIKVTALDKNGKPLEIETEGLLSRIIQHEIDHLNGILFIDHLSFVRRKLLSKKLRQMKLETLADMNRRS